MDCEPLIRSSAARLTCGLISLVIISSIIVLPNNNTENNLELVLKGPRPYKQNIAEQGRKHKIVNINKRINLFMPIILGAAEKYNVDPDLVKAVIMAESSFNPSAVSSKGAVGLMQIMPDTAESLGVKDLFNPEDNVDGGVKYLKWLLNQFDGNTVLAVAAYNAGRTKVRKYQGVPPYKTTRYYVKKVFEYYEHYQGAENIET